MRPEPRPKARTKFDVVVISGAGIDTNIYLHSNDIDFAVEANFSQNFDYVGQAGGYSARGFARLGKKIALLDYVGDDYHGAFIRRELRNDGIHVDGLLTHSSGTRRSVNFMYKDGRRKNFYDAKGAMEIRPDIHISQSILRKTKLAHFNIINFSRYLLPSAQELGFTVSCDLQDIISADDEYRREYIEAADILFFSATNHADPSPLMLKLLNRKPGSIVITGMGSRGCGIATHAGIAFYPPVDMFGPVVDTNGAGDALAVGFLSSYCMDGFSLEDSILRGQIAARWTCTQKANSSGLITKERLNAAHKLISQQGN